MNDKLITALSGFVLFIPPPVGEKTRWRRFPDHETMNEGEEYATKCDFDRLEKWAIKGMRKHPERRYGFKQVGRRMYLVGFKNSKE